MTTNIPLLRIACLFLALLFGGIVATLPLFHFNYKKFVSSSLFVKIIFWIPIFVIFVVSLYVSNNGRLVIAFLLLLLGYVELRRVLMKQKHTLIIIAYYAFFAFSLLHFYALGVDYHSRITGLLITLCFASVLSDVFAFFFGNYSGKHKLPNVLNDHKSWEGVFGQMFGAFIGVLLVRMFVIRVSSIYLFVPIGLGSAAGDLLNSYVKRVVGIKDWGKSIPGHGGYLDRLSSLSVAMLFVFYFLK